LNIRNPVPPYRLSLRKSADYTWFGAPRATSGSGSRLGIRFFARRLRLSFNAQYAIYPFVVPAVTLAAQPPIQLPKAEPGLGLGERQQRLD
jgi:hypothetical protein